MPQKNFEVGDVVRWRGSTWFRRGGTDNPWSIVLRNGHHADIEKGWTGVVVSVDDEQYDVHVWSLGEVADNFSQPSMHNSDRFIGQPPWVLATRKRRKKDGIRKERHPDAEPPVVETP